VGTPAAATELAFPAASTYAEGTQIVQSPFQFIADPDTFLRIVSCCSVTGINVAITGRRLDENGDLQVINETHVPLSTRTNKTQDYNLGAGALLNLAVYCTSGNPRMSQVYVKVQICRNAAGVAIVLGNIIGGCITQTNVLGFPGSAVIASTDTEPVARTIVGTAPGINAAVLETVPIGARWELVTFNAPVSDSVSLNTFTPIFKVNDPSANSILQAKAHYAFVAGLTGVAAWLAGYTPSTIVSDDTISGSLPTGLKLSGGSTMNLAAPGANRTWAAPVYTVREWLDV
jgi:hypothetical protein